MCVCVCGCVWPTSDPESMNGSTIVRVCVCVCVCVCACVCYSPEISIIINLDVHLLLILCRYLLPFFRSITNTVLDHFHLHIMHTVIQYYRLTNHSTVRSIPSFPMDFSILTSSDHQTLSQAATTIQMT